VAGVAPQPRRKLIEVALPLEAINRRSVREGQGQISPLHLWWSHKPAAACRAALLASVLSDPDDDAERARLLDLVARVVEAPPEDRAILAEARAAVAAACGDTPPTVLDAFSGSGAIPAEAQRLGLAAIAADLNPVAVLTAKALLEIPARFSGGRPVHPGGAATAAGLVADVLYYGERVWQQARERLGRFYPPAANGEPVIAWLWARTATCPNPACGREMTLVHSFQLCARPGKEVHLVPAADGTLRLGTAAECPAGTVDRRVARCLHCETAVPLPQFRARTRRDGLGLRLLALVTKSGRGRRYLAAEAQDLAIALAANPAWGPDTDLPQAAIGFACHNFGITRHRDLYTPRQLLALTTFAELIGEVRQAVEADARGAGLADDHLPLHAGGTGARAYAEAVSVYLAFALDRAAAKWCTFARWHRTRENIEHPFASPGLHMLWDFAEANPFSAATGNWMDAVEAVAKALRVAPAAAGPVAAIRCLQADAAAPGDLPGNLLVCTDPPYYDTLPYADMADLFYIWLRPVLRDVYPELFRTVLTPKAEELVADPHRFGGVEAARRHFGERMATAFRQLRLRADPRYPLTVFYAFKETAAEGWEVILASLLAAGLRITGTWPLRTEHAQRLRSRESNTLASSLLLVCRPQAEGAPRTTRRAWVRELRRTLPDALAALTAAGIAPLDLAQAAIGPGMATFSQYSAVLEADGSALPVRAALEAIRAALDAHLHSATGDLDGVTRFCLAWLEQHGFGEGPYGEADVLARATGVALEALAAGGTVSARGGQVRLLRGGDGQALGLWGGLHAYLRLLELAGAAAATAGATAQGHREAALRALAHRVYAICDDLDLREQAQDYSAAAVALGLREAGA